MLNTESSKHTVIATKILTVLSVFTKGWLRQKNGQYAKETPGRAFMPFSEK